jgi:hypothetical protein
LWRLVRRKLKSNSWRAEEAKQSPVDSGGRRTTMGLVLSLTDSNARVISFDVFFGKETDQPELAELAST